MTLYCYYYFSEWYYVVGPIFLEPVLLSVFNNRTDGDMHTTYHCYESVLYTVSRDDGVLVPLGPGVDTGVHNPHGYTLNYNGKGGYYLFYCGVHYYLTIIGLVYILLLQSLWCMMCLK